METINRFYHLCKLRSTGSSCLGTVCGRTQEAKSKFSDLCLSWAEEEEPAARLTITYHCMEYMKIRLCEHQESVGGQQWKAVIIGLFNKFRNETKGWKIINKR